jgi:hypothetical protein
MVTAGEGDCWPGMRLPSFARSDQIQFSVSTFEIRCTSVFLRIAIMPLGQIFGVLEVPPRLKS